MGIMEYLSGNCLDYNYFYPYTTGPSAYNLATTAELGEPIHYSKVDSTPLSPVDFLLSVSPVDCCKDFLPNDWKHFAESNAEQLEALNSAPWRRQFHTIIENISTSVSNYAAKVPGILKWNTLSPALVFMSPTKELQKCFSFSPPVTPP